MPLNASGTISLAGSTAGQSISNEFRSITTSQTSLSEYYRGGSYVGPHNGPVAASGAISFSQFYSAQKRYPVTITISANTNPFTLKRIPGQKYLDYAKEQNIYINNFFCLFLRLFYNSHHDCIR